MTKKVRIENADTSPCKVVVQVWDKGLPDGEPDKMAFERVLANPADMAGDNIFITSTRYLVIKEA